MNPTSPATTHGYLDEELAWVLGQIEDWLLHASVDALDELADFVYGPAHHGHDQLRWIIERLGVASARFRPATPAPPASSTHAHAPADRGPNR